MRTSSPATRWEHRGHKVYQLFTHCPPHLPAQVSPGAQAWGGTVKAVGGMVGREGHREGRGAGGALWGLGGAGAGAP